MGRLIISAIAISDTYTSPERVRITLTVSDAETGEPVYDLPADCIEVWDTTERAQLNHFHSYKSGLYSLFADWSERAVVGRVKVYGLLIKVKRSRPASDNDVRWDYGQVIAPLQIEA